ncbi:interleukin-6 receptor subunit beta [Esox lucius]|uniref:interleukin-6 receptor subunit beta n=1 Tax=Esox lucius TaxID=8010 RepID=UPI0014771128|nr:interleukin-6 receptor subunit beta [Esox lucius]
MRGTIFKIPDSVSAEDVEEVCHTIEGLKPFNSYNIAVSCIHDLDEGHWSDWSEETTGVTLESAPSRPPDVCYNVEKVNKDRPHQLMLMWKTLNAHDANGHILGYEVSYRQKKHPFLSRIVNTTNLKMVFEVTEEELEVAVRAYNSAGGSPYSHIKIDPRLCQTDLQLGKTYRINVYPISYELCGPPKSINANLNGALLGAVRLHIEDVTKDTVSVQWEWQQMEVHTKVLQYRVLLRMGMTQIDSFPVWPDVKQHTFFKLRANTAYSVHLVVETPNDNISSEIIPIKTNDFDFSERIIFTACGILLLILSIGIIFMLYRIV